MDVAPYVIRLFALIANNKRVPGRANTPDERTPVSEVKLVVTTQLYIIITLP